jgi:hypothetical protein
MSNHMNKPLTKLLGPREIVQNNQKTGFYAVFSILGPFGHPQVDLKDTQWPASRPNV